MPEVISYVLQGFEELKEMVKVLAERLTNAREDLAEKLAGVEQNTKWLSKVSDEVYALGKDATGVQENLKQIDKHQTLQDIALKELQDRQGESDRELARQQVKMIFIGTVSAIVTSAFVGWLFSKLK